MADKNDQRRKAQIGALLRHFRAPSDEDFQHENADFVDPTTADKDLRRSEPRPARGKKTKASKARSTAQTPKRSDQREPVERRQRELSERVVSLVAAILHEHGEPILLAADEFDPQYDDEIPSNQHRDLPPDEFQWLTAVVAADTTNFFLATPKTQASDTESLKRLLRSEPLPVASVSVVRDLFSRHQLKPKGVSRPAEAQHGRAQARRAVILEMLARQPTREEQITVAAVLDDYDLARPVGGRQIPQYYKSEPEYRLDQADAVFVILENFRSDNVRSRWQADEERRTHEILNAGFLGHTFELTDRESAIKAAATCANVDWRALKMRVNGRRGTSNGWRKMVPPPKAPRSAAES